MKDEVIVRFPASCGELVQGYCNEKTYLCSYAIDCYSYACITKLSSSPKTHKKMREKFHLKALQAVRNFLRDHNYCYESVMEQVSFEIVSDIPVGKGMGSSTADIIASLWAFAYFLNIPLNSRQVALYCTQIEPTDSIVHGDLSLAEADTGSLIYKTDNFFHYDILCLIPCDTLDTQQYRSLLYDKKIDKVAYEHLYKDFLLALEKKDLDAVAYFSIKSAYLNETILQKPYLKELVSLTKIDGVKGLNVAHSGTIISIWFDSHVINSLHLSKMINNIDKEQYYRQHIHYQTVEGQPECVRNL